MKKSAKHCMVFILLQFLCTKIALGLSCSSLVESIYLKCLHKNCDILFQKSYRFGEYPCSRSPQLLPSDAKIGSYFSERFKKTNINVKDGINLLEIKISYFHYKPMNTLSELKKIMQKNYRSWMAYSKIKTLDLFIQSQLTTLNNRRITLHYIGPPTQTLENSIRSRINAEVRKAYLNSLWYDFRKFMRDYL